MRRLPLILLIVLLCATLAPRAQAATDYRALQWALDATHTPAAWVHATGVGATVCSVDTGVSASAPDVANAILAGVNTVTPASPEKWADDEGHGTFTASEIVGRGDRVQGVAPDARLLVAKVLAADGSGSDASVVEGMFWCVAHGASVINMSLGGTGSPYTGMEEAVAYACAHNVALAVSQGNDGKRDTTTQPASVQSPCLVAVSASGRNGDLTDFSNYGENTRSVLAPGANLLGLTVSGGVTFMSGTSMAAPLVSGEVALLMGLGASARTAVATVLATAVMPKVAKKYTTRRPNAIYGYGLVNIGAAVARYLTRSAHRPSRL